MGWMSGGWITELCIYIQNCVNIQSAEILESQDIDGGQHSKSHYSHQDWLILTSHWSRALTLSSHWSSRGHVITPWPLIGPHSEQIKNTQWADSNERQHDYQDSLKYKTTTTQEEMRHDAMRLKLFSRNISQKVCWKLFWSLKIVKCVCDIHTLLSGHVYLIINN